MGLEVSLTTAQYIYDITQLVDKITFDDNINKCGTCSFNVLKNKDIVPSEEHAVMVKYDGDTYFSGHIFKVGMSQKQQYKITANDQLRYLKTKETYVFNNMTASGWVRQIGNDFGLTLGTIEETGYNLGSRPYDGKDVLDIISDAIKLTLVGTQNMYYLKDDAGAVVFRNIRNSMSDLFVSPDSTMYDYDYERSIDDNTYNQIKLVRDNKDTGQRELYITRDSSTIQKWGLLQYYEKLDDNVNAEQARQKADSLLTLRNRVQQKLSVDILGDKSIRAGNMVYVGLPDAQFEKWLLCTSAKHTFGSTGHTVKAEFKIV